MLTRGMNTQPWSSRPLVLLISMQEVQAQYLVNLAIPPTLSNILIAMGQPSVCCQKAKTIHVLEKYLMASKVLYGASGHWVD